MERLLLSFTGYKLGLASPLPFLRRFSKAASNDSRVHSLAKYILELTPAHYSLLDFLPSELAAACVYLARHMTHTLPLWHSTVRHYSGYSEHAILPCARALNRMLQATDITKNYIARKYNSSRLLSVSAIALRPL
jgi:transcription initiation factor TFIIIB Brf1 subunit/transcription initiation factor TFIIB